MKREIAFKTIAMVMETIMSSGLISADGIKCKEYNSRQRILTQNVRFDFCNNENNTFDGEFVDIIISDIKFGICVEDNYIQITFNDKRLLKQGATFTGTNITEVISKMRTFIEALI